MCPVIGSRTSSECGSLEEVLTETGKGTGRGAASFSDEEGKVGVGLLDGLVVGLEEFPVRCKIRCSSDTMKKRKINTSSTSHCEIDASVDIPGTCGGLTGLAEVETNLLERLGEGSSQCVGRHAEYGVDRWVTDGGQQWRCRNGEQASWAGRERGRLPFLHSCIALCRFVSSVW